jgi:TolA-binding protein
MNTADSVRIKQLEEQVRQLQDENKKLRNEFDEYKLLHEPLITPTKKRKSPTEIDSDYAEDDDQVEKPTKKRKVATPKQSALDAATVSEEEIQRQIS